MKKKIITIISIIVFILILIILALFLNKDQQNGTNELYLNKEDEGEMKVLQVTSKNFESEVLNSDKIVLIDFYADWCGPCKMLSPIIEEIAEENSKVKVVKINVDDEQNLAIKYQVMSIPTIVVIKNGEETNRSIGFVEKTRILEMIK